MKPAPRILILVMLLSLAACSSMKNMTCNETWLVLGPLGLFNCNKASGTPFTKLAEVPKSHAVIYVYRPFSAIEGLSAPDIYVNDQLYGELQNRGYLPLAMPAGSVSLKIKSMIGTYDISIDTEPGKSYYLRVTPRIVNVTVIGNMAFSEKELVLAVIGEANATPEISDTKLSNIHKSSHQKDTAKRTN
ncbi:MAG: DUF2846 domain-containing protein [Gammaproteobacteria bacterium]|nr:DUF2846 domain-containing protein [Gammaproteobacteria bacterium]